jgi:hypothetical protein
LERALASSLRDHAVAEDEAEDSGDGGETAHGDADQLCDC